MTRTALLAAALVLIATLAAAPSDASTINWVLSGVTFDDGGATSGTFSTDSTSGNVTAFNITTTAGTTLGGANYNWTAINTFSSNGIYSPNSFILTNFDTSTYINLEFVNPLTGPGIDELILSGGSYECAICNPVRGIVSGEAIAATTPLPAALPLLASGLGALGLLGWRRKRKAQAAA